MDFSIFSTNVCEKTCFVSRFGAYEVSIRLFRHSYWDKMLKVVHGGLNYLQSRVALSGLGIYLGGEFSQSV